VRPALVPVASPHTSSPGVIKWRLERLIASGLKPEHPVVHALAGRYHALRRSMVPQRGSVTPAAIAWERASQRTPGHMNRRMRKFLARDADARMAFLAECA
jgi:hypothetical protein